MPGRAILLLAVGAALLAAGPAGATSPGGVLPWGCSGAGYEHGQCTAAGSGVNAIAANDVHSLALKSNGAVLAWGCHGPDSGQCAVPGEAASGVTAIGVTAIAAGAVHSLALRDTGGVVAWGCGAGVDYGQCTVPAAATSGVTAVAAGAYHSLALKNGGVLAWGCASPFDFGQCTVPAAATSGVIGISAGYAQSLALKSNGSVVAWGCNGFDHGQCTVPAAAAGGVTAIAAGYAHSLALKSGGATAVFLRRFWAMRIRSGTLLRWRTGSEVQILGFNVYKQQRRTVVRLNRPMIHAHFWLDRQVRSRGAVYRLQSVGLDGTRTWIGRTAIPPR